MWGSLRGRLVALVLSVFVPLCGLAVYQSIHARGQAFAEVRLDVEESARFAEQELSVLIRGAVQLAYAMGESPALLGRDLRACSATLEAQMKRGRRYATLVVADRDGQLLCSSEPGVAPANYADREHFKLALATRQQVIGKPVIGRVVRQAIVPIAQPLLDAEGHVQRMLLVGLNLSWFGDAMSELPSAKELVVVISDGEGRVLYRKPDNEKWFGQRDPEAPINQALNTRRDIAAFEAPGLDGVTRIYAFAHGRDYPQGDLVIRVGAARDLLTAAADRALAIELAILIAVALLVVIAVIVIAEKFVRGPVAMLARAADKLATGDLSVRVPRGELQGELSTVATAFNGMAEALAGQIAAVRDSEERQHKADARYREVLQMAADGIISIDEEQRIVVFNAGAEQLFGYAADDAIGKSLDILLPQEISAAHSDHVRAFGSGPERSRAMADRRRLHGRRKDGTLFDAEVDISRHRESGGMLYTAVVRDVTERAEQEEMIARLTRIYRILSGINSAIVRIHDRAALFEEVCRIAVEDGGFGIVWIGLYNHETRELVPVACGGVDAESIVAKRRGVPLRFDLPLGMVARTIQNKQVTYSNDLPAEPAVGDGARPEALRRGYHSGIVLPLIIEDQLAGTMTLYTKESGFFNDEEIKLLDELASDVAFALDHIAKEEKLNYLAYYDQLTGIANRTLFGLQLEQRLTASRREKMRPFFVAIFNLERFRNVNETLGRQASDKLLQQVAQRLKDAAGGTGLLARVGGDHFAVSFLRNEDAGRVVRFVEGMLAAVFDPPFEAGTTQLRLSARAGIAVYPTDGEDADSLYRNAEAALRSAKSTGYRFQFYAPQMNATLTRTLLLENKLRDALEKQQFVMHYQPKVDLATGVLCGLEGLIRWNDPDGGLISPQEFIPLLEETGMIVEAGRWAFHQALDDLQEWSRLGLQPPRVSVNVSAVQFRREDFVRSVREAIAASDSEKLGLDLEITESIIMEDIEDNIAKLRAFKDMGVGIHVDDFGTGYSSLSYLAKLPVSTLKIDQSFVRNMVTASESMTIVSTIISLAHSLDLVVVAEGVETEDQAKYLRLLKCNAAQGDLYGKPLPADEVARMLRAPRRALSA